MPLMGKLTISTVIFNGKLLVYQRVWISTLGPNLAEKNIRTIQFWMQQMGEDRNCEIWNMRDLALICGWSRDFRAKLWNSQTLFLANLKDLSHAILLSWWWFGAYALFWLASRVLICGMDMMDPNSCAAVDDFDTCGSIISKCVDPRFPVISHTSPWRNFRSFTADFAQEWLLGRNCGGRQWRVQVLCLGWDQQCPVV